MVMVRPRQAGAFGKTGSAAATGLCGEETEEDEPSGEDCGLLSSGLRHIRHLRDANSEAAELGCRRTSGRKRKDSTGEEGCKEERRERNRKRQQEFMERISIERSGRPEGAPIQGGDRGRHGLRREAAPGAPQKGQKRNFNANCNWRALPKSPVGKRVLVMLEKLAAVENTVAPVGLKGPGWPKLG